ncbi:polyprenyl synthetase family protein [Mycobacteroides salmoniphilum]|uniref:Heptaprenyl diphosphate synthase component 2 n=1 Tax=Mycobacteroides salmoniphilum TaxID=404941 RepID=A0A4V3I0J1_9MYCO|nr:polyprenyl synthetase family protein [Mycobacteroides salmoniphilum]TDZ91301.1 Heptaprenyl diphosphate synthase component 2 [Mycobacteroides salmoniphilum]TEA01177.1 Heptaprenyl diphosphate synthase component 2 [Mycobacteroides salmoniphilum]
MSVSGGVLVGGIDLGDPVLTQIARQGLEDVERRLAIELDDYDERVLDAVSHLSRAGGKCFRSLFTLLAAQFGPGADDPQVVLAAAMIEIAHLATLYHDDVMDGALVRRGVHSANAMWDNKIAVLAGDYLIGRVLRIAAALGEHAMDIIGVTFTELVAGQMQETMGAPAETDPEAHYWITIRRKTSVLIAAAGQLGAQLAGARKEHIDCLYRFGDLLGTMFQISDDIIDVSSDFEQSGKAIGTDLREGIITLPMLYAMRDDSPAGRRLREVLHGPIDDPRLVDEALFLINEAQGVKLAAQKLVELGGQAQSDLLQLPENPARQAFSNLIQHMATRVA